MENATSILIVGEQTPEQIGRDMEVTRESIGEKVAALENQVLGTIQTATDTVTDTVQAVKEAVTTAPAAVHQALRDTVDSVKESVSSFSASECIRSNPVAALGTVATMGLLAGYFLGGSRRHSPQWLAAPREAAPVAAPPISRAPAVPTLLSGMLGNLGDEAMKLGERMFASTVLAIQRSIETRMPQIVEAATNRLTGLIESSATPSSNGFNRCR